MTIKASGTNWYQITAETRIFPARAALRQAHEAYDMYKYISILRTYQRIVVCLSTDVPEVPQNQVEKIHEVTHTKFQGTSIENVVSLILASPRNPKEHSRGGVVQVVFGGMFNESQPPNSAKDAQRDLAKRATKELLTLIFFRDDE